LYRDVNQKSIPSSFWGFAGTARTQLGPNLKTKKRCTGSESASGWFSPSSGQGDWNGPQKFSCTGKRKRNNFPPRIENCRVGSQIVCQLRVAGQINGSSLALSLWFLPLLILYNMYRRFAPMPPHQPNPNPSLASWMARNNLSCKRSLDVYSGRSSWLKLQQRVRDKN